MEPGRAAPGGRRRAPPPQVSLGVGFLLGLGCSSQVPFPRPGGPEGQASGRRWKEPRIWEGAEVSVLAGAGGHRLTPAAPRRSRSLPPPPSAWTEHDPQGPMRPEGRGGVGQVSVCLSLPATPGETGMACCLGDVICRSEKMTQGCPATSTCGALALSCPRWWGWGRPISSEVSAAGALLPLPPPPDAGPAVQRQHPAAGLCKYLLGCPGCLIWGCCYITGEARR